MCVFCFCFFFSNKISFHQFFLFSQENSCH
jgi:hypothetical protein